jgi:hypothetical protein
MSPNDKVICFFEKANRPGVRLLRLDAFRRRRGQGRRPWSAPDELADRALAA